MIKIKKAIVVLTEQTLRELSNAVNKARKTITFTKEPMPDSDMDMKTYRRLKASRGAIRVTSQYDATEFEIHVEVESGTQESSGYSLNTD